MAEEGSLLVLGLGNVLCGDDGLGVAAVAEIHRRYAIPDHVQVLDGGTLGLALLSYFEKNGDVILVDAIAADQEAGSFVRLEGDDVAPAVRHRLSVHQIGVADLLDSLRLIDSFPRRLVLLGLVPETIDLGLEKSKSVGRMMPYLLERIVEEVQRLGYELEPKEENETAVAGPAGTATGPFGLS